MKIRFLFICCILSSYIFSQQKLQGTITSNTKKPLEGASIYLNNTTVGDVTDSEGNFDLRFTKGNYTLIISYLGYKTVTKAINAKTPENLNFTLEEEDTFLDEVHIKKIVYDEDWKFNLSRFKKAFLGTTKLAQQCKILNEKDLRFTYNFKTNTLTADTKKPLKIRHSGLGYMITYDLADFSLNDKTLFFSGYAQYKNLRKSIRKKWKRNRRRAFNGSTMHFFRSLIDSTTSQQGFVINQFERVLNPERPSDEKIRFARELIKLHNHSYNFSKKITNPKTSIDSAVMVVQKSTLPKYRDYLYKKGVSPKNVITFDRKVPFLDFKDYLMVIYTKEEEEERYLTAMFGRKKKATGVQTSNIVLLNGKSQIDISGILIDPNGSFKEGYWAFEAFADMLPLDYKP